MMKKATHIADISLLLPCQGDGGQVLFLGAYDCNFICSFVTVFVIISVSPRERATKMTSIHR